MQNLESTDRGVALLEQVVRRAPGFARGYAELAGAHMVRVLFGFVTPREGWPLVRSLAEQAAAVDPACTQAQFVLAQTAFLWEWDWAKAAPLFLRAIELDPNDADALSNYAMYLVSIRRFDEAVRLSRQAIALDPLNPGQFLRAMICMYLARRFDETLALCDRAIEMIPEYPESYRWQGMALLASGHLEASVAALEMATRISGRNVWRCTISGSRSSLPAALPRRERSRRSSRHAPFMSRLPALARTLGPQCADPVDLDGVFRMLDLWYAERGFWSVMLDVEPAFDWLRADARFADLVARVGIPVGA